MSYSDERLEQVFEKTDGNCHICGGGLCLSNYGRNGTRGAWEVEHSRPRAGGGTDHLNNLFAAHVSCNRAKGKKPTRSARAQNGRKAAPRSAAKKKNVRAKNTVAGGGFGAAIGFVLGGPGGAALGTAIGGAIGNNIDPDSE